MKREILRMKAENGKRFDMGGKKDNVEDKTDSTERGDIGK